MVINPQQPLKVLFLYLFIIAILTYLAPSHAQTAWTVCPQGPPGYASSSIQQAIDAPAPGDTIFVQPGFYHESLLIRKSITIQGTGPQQVVIQGSRPGWPVVSIWTVDPGDLFNLVFGQDSPITVTLQNIQIQNAPWVSSEAQCADFSSNICPDGLAVRGHVTLTANNLWIHDNGDDAVDLGLHPKATVQNCYNLEELRRRGPRPARCRANSFEQRDHGERL